MTLILVVGLMLANGATPRRAPHPLPHVLLIATARTTTWINYPSRERYERARGEAIRQHSQRSPEGILLSGVYEANCRPL